MNKLPTSKVLMYMSTGKKEEFQGNKDFLDYMFDFKEKRDNILNKDSYLPEDPFWDIEDQTTRDFLNKFLLSSYWYEGGFNFTDLFNPIGDLSSPQTIEILQYEISTLGIDNDRLNILSVGEYIFDIILDYLTTSEIINLALTSKFAYLVIEANMHSNYIQKIGQFPSPKLCGLANLLILMETPKGKTYSQLYALFLIYMKNGLFMGIKNIIEVVRNKYNIDTRGNNEGVTCQFIRQFISRELIIGSRIVNPFQFLCERNYTEILEYLITLDIIFKDELNVDKLTCFEIAIRHKNTRLMTLVAESAGSLLINESYYEKAKCNLFIQAVFTNDYKTIQTLFQLCENYNVHFERNDLNYPIYLAVKLEAIHVLPTLLAHPYFNINNINIDEKSVLMLSIRLNNKTIFKLLIQDQNLDINIQNSKGKSALFYAVQYIRIKFAIKLSELNGNWNQVSKTGNSILHMALKSKCRKLIELAVIRSSYANFHRVNIEGLNSRRLLNKINSENIRNFYNKCQKEKEKDNLTKKAIRIQGKQKNPISIELIKMKLDIEFATKNREEFHYNYELIKNNVRPKRRSSEPVLYELTRLKPRTLPGEITHPCSKEPIYSSYPYMIEKNISGSANKSTVFVKAKETDHLTKGKIARICLFLLFNQNKEILKRKYMASKFTRLKRKLMTRKTTIYVFETIKPLSTPISQKHKFLDNAEINLSEERKQIFWFLKKSQNRIKEKQNINNLNSLIGIIKYLKKLKEEMEQKLFYGIQYRMKSEEMIPKIVADLGLFKSLYRIYEADPKTLDLIFPIFQDKMKELNKEEYFINLTIQKDNIMTEELEMEKWVRKEIINIKPIEPSLYDRLLGNNMRKLTKPSTRSISSTKHNPLVLPPVNNKLPKMKQSRSSKCFGCKNPLTTPGRDSLMNKITNKELAEREVKQEKHKISRFGDNVVKVDLNPVYQESENISISSNEINFSSELENNGGYERIKEEISRERITDNSEKEEDYQKITPPFIETKFIKRGSLSEIESQTEGTSLHDSRDNSYKHRENEGAINIPLLPSISPNFTNEAKSQHSIIELDKNVNPTLPINCEENKNYTKNNLNISSAHQLNAYQSPTNQKPPLYITKLGYKNKKYNEIVHNKFMNLSLDQPEKRENFSKILRKYDRGALKERKSSREEISAKYIYEDEVRGLQLRSLSPNLKYKHNLVNVNSCTHLETPKSPKFRSKLPNISGNSGQKKNCVMRKDLQRKFNLPVLKFQFGLFYSESTPSTEEQSIVSEPRGDTRTNAYKLSRAHINRSRNLLGFSTSNNTNNCKELNIKEICRIRQLVPSKSAKDLADHRQHKRDKVLIDLKYLIDK